VNIKQNFDRAAPTYDSFADVQAEVAERLAALLPEAAAAGHSIIELGCGTGALTARLRQRYPGSRLVAVDFAYRMLARAAAKLGREQVMWVCQDIASFLAQPADAKVDMFVSNATLQWLPDLGAVLSDLHRKLKPGGLLLFSVFGPNSLAELQQTLNAVLPGQARLAAGDFVARQTYRDLLGRHFTVELDQERMIARSYGSVLELLRQIGRTGTGGAHPRPLRLSRRHLAAMDALFAATYGGCRVTYQVLFFRCRA